MEGKIIIYKMYSHIDCKEMHQARVLHYKASAENVFFGDPG